MSGIIRPPLPDCFRPQAEGSKDRPVHPRTVFALLALCCFARGTLAAGQTTAAIRIDVTAGEARVADAEVVVNGMTYKTGTDGVVTIPVAPGRLTLTVAKESFAPVTSSVTVAAGQTQTVVVQLQPQPTLEEEITVSATRTDRRLEDQPMRVEVLAREEIEEKMLMTPGDIVMMLNEMGGMRVQATSPSLGAASVRIQGMRGRYTRVFSDGLPLFGEVGGLGLLQIPPMDLGQVEVIKGVASSMYGAGAMGGIVNLISRRPAKEKEREFLFNRSTRGATDAVAWYASPARQGWSFTLLGGGHWQDSTDVNDDAWADLPGYTRGLVRPRVFWDGGNGRTFFATAGFTAEDRTGGTIPGGVLAATGAPYLEALETRRADVGVVGQVPFNRRYLLSARIAVTQQRHDHQFGEVRERDRHNTVFAEATLRASFSRHTLVGGVALERDSYTPTDVPRFAYTFTVPGIFLQDDVEVGSWLSVSASGRLDVHDEYGTFFSPRVAALFRASNWNSRISIGTGFFAPSPLTEETEAAGLSRLQIPQPLTAEEGRSVSVDISRTDGPVSYTFTVFGSKVQHPIYVDRSTGLVLANLIEPTTNVGIELLGTLRHEPYSLTASYTYVRSRELADGTRDDVALTPRHSAGVVGMWEKEDVGRIGVEFYYTGVQRLEENPYRDRSQPYVIVGVLAERQFGRVRLFINGENLTGVRQTRWDPLIRPTRAPDGRWTVDAWQPLDGRTINGGIRIRF
jgi:outer membrane receptor for ferrienterochelin and colicins